MNTYLFKALRSWATLLVCCLLLTAAQAQDTTPPTSDDGKTTTFDEHEKHHHHAHNNDDVVGIGRDAELAAGAHASGVVSVFGSATSAGDVDQDVVSVLGSTHITGGTVGQQAVAVLGSVYINGEVNGEVVAVLGNVELGPEARVHGNITIVGGDLKKDPAAVVDGHVENVIGVDWANFDWARPWIQRCLLYGRPLAFSSGLGWAWGIALGILALYVFMAVVFRGAVDKCVHTLETEPGPSILAALVLTLAIPVLIVLLAITVVGIAAIPFLVIGLVGATIFGKVVVLAAIGKRCTPSLANDPVSHTVIGVIVGGLILLVVYTLPVLGFVIYKLTDLLGLGVVAYALLVAVRARRRALWGGPGRGGGAAGGGMPGVGGGPTAAPHAEASRGADFIVGRNGRAEPRFSEAADFTAAAGGGAAHADTDAARRGTDTSAGAATGAGAAAGTGSGVGAGVGTAQEQPRAGGGESTPGRSDGPEAAGAAFGDRQAGPGGGPGGSNMNSGSVGGGAAGGGPSPYTTSAPSGQAPLNVAALPRAGFGIRMGALLLDIILVGIVTQQLHDHDVFLVLLAAYGAVMWKLKGSTIGGIICGLQVVRVDGRLIDWPTAVVRALSCFLSLAVVGLGFIWIAIDHDRQGWHDKIAGTAVVRAPKGTSLL